MGHPAFFISDIYAILDPANLDLAFAATPVIDEIEALVPGNPTATSSNLAPVKRRKTLNSLVERVAGISQYHTCSLGPGDDSPRSAETALDWAFSRH